MNDYRSLARIALACGLIVAFSASIACCEPWDPLGIQNHNQYKPFGKYGPKITISTLSPTKVMNGGSLGQANQRAARRVAPSGTTRFEALNLSVTMPSGPWVKLDPKETGSRASYLISRSDPWIVISFAGERAGTEAGHTNNSLLAESKAKMTSLPGGAIEPGERQLSAAGIQGVAYEATVVDGQFTAYYSIWVAAHHGYNYQLAVYGDQEHKPAIDAAMRDFVRGIKQIQPTRVARGNSNKKAVTR
jgi:hypothetical protein